MYENGVDYVGVEAVPAQFALDTDGPVTDLSVREYPLVRPDDPWTDAFDVDAFYKVPYVVARPIPQRYVIDGEEYTLVKPREELQDSVWSLDGTPGTVEHPDSGTVTTDDEVDTWFDDPEYDTDDEALRAYEYVPDDEVVIDAVEATPSVSVGFTHRGVPVDEYDGDIGSITDASDVDGVQTTIRHDHVAHVERGRCPIEAGCGPRGASVTAGPTGRATVAGDGTDDGPRLPEGLRTAADAVRTVATEESMTEHANDPMTDASVGDWVRWGSRGGSAYGKIDEIVREGCTTRGKGDKEVCAEDDDPVAVVEVYDDETGESNEEMVRHHVSTLHSWDGPTTDTALACDCSFGRSCSPGPCECGLHVRGDAEIGGTTIDLTVPDGAQSAAQAFLDANDAGVVPDDCGTGVGTESARMIADGEVTAERLVSDIAPYLNSHEEDTSTDTHPSDWPIPDEDDDIETPWTDCGDAQYAAWGWHSLTDWARRKADQIKQARGEEPVYDSAATLPGVYTVQAFVDETTVMDTITYDGLRNGELDESEIPNEGYEPHYVFDADTKSESSYPLVDGDGMLRRGNVKAAWELYGRAEDEGFLLDVLAEVNGKFDSQPIPPDSLNEAMTDDDSDSNTMTDDTDMDNPFEYVSDLALDELRASNDAVAQALDEKDERIEELEEQKEALQENNEGLKETIDALETGERTPKAELVGQITTATDRWDEETLYEKDRDTLRERLELVEDLVGDTSSTTPTDDGGNGAENGPTDDPATNEIPTVEVDGKTQFVLAEETAD